MALECALHPEPVVEQVDGDELAGGEGDRLADGSRSQLEGSGGLVVDDAVISYSRLGSRNRLISATQTNAAVARP